MSHRILVLSLLLIAWATAPGEIAAEIRVIETVEVSDVWSGHPVGFALLTAEPRQFVAFYDASRRMTVGVRNVDSDRWHFARLPQTLGWDSHNGIALALDSSGHLHLAGNMHAVPLIYFRTREPFDVDTLERVPTMIDKDEARCTYPKFFQGPDGQLVFTYRSGSSGNGDQIYNVYDVETRTWRRLLDAPLTSGEGLRNAYFHGPRLGPDGYYHLVWVWRDTPDCATNHDVSYARSRDLVRWEKSDGTPLTLPMTLGSCEIVDPVPPGGGVINGNAVLGFDSKRHPVISYHKYDSDGATQIYNARLEDGKWKVYRASDWDYRWEFGGGGSIVFEIRVGAVTAGTDGRLLQTFRHPKRGSGRWVLDPETLQVTETLPPRSDVPAELRPVRSSSPGMQVRWCGDSGRTGDKTQYRLRWESLPAHRDRPREGDPPPPSRLTLHRLKEVDG